MSAWWWPGVSVGLGAVLGLLGTLALISLLLALVQLLLHGCSPKRAFPNCPCWCTVSAGLYHRFILKGKTLLLIADVSQSASEGWTGGWRLPGHHQRLPQPVSLSGRAAEGSLLHLWRTPWLGGASHQLLLCTCCGRTLSPAL